MQSERQYIVMRTTVPVSVDMSAVKMYRSSQDCVCFSYDNTSAMIEAPAQLMANMQVNLLLSSRDRHISISASVFLVLNFQHDELYNSLMFINNTSTCMLHQSVLFHVSYSRK